MNKIKNLLKEPIVWLFVSLVELFIVNRSRLYCNFATQNFLTNTIYFSSLLAGFMVFLVTFYNLLKSKTIPNILHKTIIFGSLAAFFIANTTPFFPYWQDDQAQYLLEAIALLEGNVVELGDAISLMISNSNNISVAPRYAPWGLPLLLYPLLALGITTPEHLMHLSFISGAAIVWWVISCYAKKMSNIQLMATILCFLSTTSLLPYSNYLMPDVPMLFFCVSALLLMDQLYNTHTIIHRSKRIIYLLMLCVLILFAIETRSYGYILIVCLISLQLRQMIISRSVKIAFDTLFLALLIGSGYYLIRQLIPVANTDVGQQVFQSLNWQAILQMFYKYFKKLPTFFFPSPLKIISQIIFYLSAIPISLAVHKHGVKYMHIIIWVVLNFIGIVILPFYGVRYLLPLLPFYYLALILGIGEVYNLKIVQNILNRISKKWLLTLFMLIATGILGACNIYNVMSRKIGPDSHQSTPESKEMFAFIRDKIDKSTLVAVSKSHRTYYLYTKHLVTRCKLAEESLEKYSCFCIHKSDIAYAYRKKQTEQIKFLEKLKERSKFEIIFENPGYIIYQKIVK